MSKKSDAWLKLIQAVANVETELGKFLQAGHGLGLSEYRALEVLARSPDCELRMQELAAYLHLNQSSVSRMVERLERGGLTIRDLCPDDKRGVYTVLTEKGRDRLERAQPDYEKALDAALMEGGCEDLLAARYIEARA
ncbi:MarR family winged helix-turn-helix transcriptional regulator [Sinorhizobium mexicanum]|uniref:MarR family transcriptional regulator n=1 Tax=Sinorhizobium mexicanum TaxID=375549 RepID=A0A859QKH3_9HYPH|nr:MarR family transcriptional regulator [Sinorhizobium mexicanum]MBP1885829.1 DNA-binding MarR family transcriptional regulator [Sinorhizobium mexicanum]QLL60496.1 MarR family transcriptional regulator [Sinorhizobium mexicanum]